MILCKKKYSKMIKKCFFRERTKEKKKNKKKEQEKKKEIGEEKEKEKKKKDKEKVNDKKKKILGETKNTLLTIEVFPTKTSRTTICRLICTFVVRLSSTCCI